ncbi:hypothetical protein NLI96_g10548 [Meripilus lineatus]|uniref:Protein kinase domain-containing protein n=1 Tax=Meripilus lineatus TaxID=2056292 RepID=A0AAD5UV29_9APHY|nr:hypothetical protein NLI96_g10548 [Physisporinus lineatus]
MYHPVANRRNRNFKGKAKYHTRTARPAKYFLIDFGLSRKYTGDDCPMEIPILGGDKTVPEFQGEGEYQPHDPFPTDIYYLGNMIREDFLQKTKGLDFIKPLVDDMVQDDPTKRPTIGEVVKRFNESMASLSYWKLRSRLVDVDDPTPLSSIHHLFRTLIHILTFRSPIPSITT